MDELIFLVEDAAEGGYTARALGEAIFTEADDLESLRVNVRDAVQCHFEEEKRPKLIRLQICWQGLKLDYLMLRNNDLKLRSSDILVAHSASCGMKHQKNL